MTKHYARTLIDVNAGQLHLHEDVLDNLCQQINGKNVAVISTAGKFRKGKTFWNNVLLQGLRKEVAKFEDDEIIGGVDGFAFQCGQDRDTRGIMVWSEVFFRKDKNGNNIAVLLIDTQGTFDLQSEMQDSTTIFALSLLLSSRKIFNAVQPLDAKDLDSLSVFIAFSQLDCYDSDRVGQDFLFLVRDAPIEPHGLKGGELYLQNLKKSTKKSVQMQSFWESICGAFTSVTACTIPRPSESVISGSSEIRAMDCGKDFLENMSACANHILETISPKMLGNDPLTGNSLKAYVQSIVTHCQNAEKKGMCSALEATTRLFFDRAQQDGMQTFQETAEELLGSNSERIPPEDFAGKLDIARKKAYETYDSMQKYGKKETKALEQESFRKALNEKIKSKINHHLARYRDVLFVEALKDGVDTYVQAAKLKAADLFCEVDDSAETFNELLSRHKKARSEAFELFDKRTNYFIDDEGPLVKAKRKELDKKIEEHFLATKREVASKFYRTSRTRLGNELVGVVRKSLEDSRSYVQDHHEMESFITEAQGKASLHFIGKVRELVEELTMTFEFLDSLQLEKYFNAYKSEQIERMITNEIASYKLGCETKFSLAGLKEKLNEVQEKGVGDKDKMEKEAQKWQRQAQTIFEKIQGLSAENDQRAKKRVEESEQFDSLQETFTNSDKKYDKLKAENERLERELREVKASNQLLSKVDSSAEPFVNKAKDKKRLNLATRLAANEILLGGSAEKIAEEIRKQMEKRCGGKWVCVVGFNQGAASDYLDLDFEIDSLRIQLLRISE